MFGIGAEAVEVNLGQCYVSQQLLPCRLLAAVRLPGAIEDRLGLGAIRLGYVGDPKRAALAVEIEELAQAPEILQPLL